MTSTQRWGAAAIAALLGIVTIALAGPPVWTWLVTPYSHYDSKGKLVGPPPLPDIPGPDQIDTPFMVPGVRLPPMVPAAQARLADSDEVVGVCLQGRCRAYRVNALASMTGHVVNDLIEGRPVTVTYCNETNCVRAFTHPERTSPLDISTAGRKSGEMGLYVGTAHFPQTSKHIPFPDLPFERTTWKAWRELHPDTEVYVETPAADGPRSPFSNNPGDAR